MAGLHGLTYAANNLGQLALPIMVQFIFVQGEYSRMYASAGQFKLCILGTRFASWHGKVILQGASGAHNSLYALDGGYAVSNSLTSNLKFHAIVTCCM